MIAEFNPKAEENPAVSMVFFRKTAIFYERVEDIPRARAPDGLARAARREHPGRRNMLGNRGNLFYSSAGISWSYCSATGTPPPCIMEPRQ
jgi:hypothetical protein